MKFLRLAVDRNSNASLGLIQEDSSVYLYRRVKDHRDFTRTYNSVTKALKAFDKQVEEDYSSLGVYYDSFETE